MGEKIFKEIALSPNNFVVAQILFDTSLCPRQLLKEAKRIHSSLRLIHLFNQPSSNKLKMSQGRAFHEQLVNLQPWLEEHLSSQAHNLQ